MTRDVQHVPSVGVIIVAAVGVLSMFLLLDFPRVACDAPKIITKNSVVPNVKTLAT
jgi:hypothetical protein